jgi:hypothetical protein
MGENLGDDPGLFDGGDDLEFAATVGAMFHIDIEHPLTNTFPGFRPSGRHSPSKTAPGGFVSSRAQLMRAELA